MQQSGINLSIDFDLLIENEITLDGWFLLYSLTNNKSDLFINYVKTCGKSKSDHIQKLVDKGFIILNDKSNISFSTIKITDSGKKLVKLENKELEKRFDENFIKLRETYPKLVPAENGTFRRLHGDLSRCRKIYKKTIMSNEGFIDQELHNKIIKSIEKLVYEYTKSKRLPFMQNLVTYLHQQNYLQYFEDADKEEQLEVQRGDDI